MCVHTIAVTVALECETHTRHLNFSAATVSYAQRCAVNVEICASQPILSAANILCARESVQFIVMVAFGT